MKDLDLCLVGPAGNELTCKLTRSGSSETISYAVSGTYPTGAGYSLRVKRVTATSSIPYTLNATWPVTAYVNLELYNPSGPKVASSATTAKPESLSYSATATGTYTLKVISADHAAAYTLNASYRESAYANLTYRVKDAAGTVLGGATSSGGSIAIEPFLPTAGTYTLEVINNSSDIPVPSMTVVSRVPTTAVTMSLVLKDASGTTVATGAGTKPKSLTAAVSPGRYSLVMTTNAANANATLTATYPGPRPAQKITYDANDHATSIDDGTTKATETLAPTGRVLRRVVEDSETGVVTEDVLFGYDGTSDSPAYSKPSGGGPATTYVAGPSGVSFIDVGGTPTYQLANLHGDIVGTTDAAGTFTAYADVDEFGVGPEPASRLGWLGSKSRFSEGTTYGLVRMGVRLYEPRLGRFLQVDPVEGGSANDYDYVSGDPVNSFDLVGTHQCTVAQRARVGSSALHCGKHSRVKAKKPEPRRTPRAKPRPTAKRPKKGGGILDLLTWVYVGAGCLYGVGGGAAAGAYVGGHAGPAGAFGGAIAGGLAGCGVGGAEAYFTSSPVRRR